VLTAQLANDGGRLAGSEKNAAIDELGERHARAHASAVANSLPDSTVEAAARLTA
jgi:hypothetical protein